MAHAAGVPVAWNAPGIPADFPPWAWPLVRASVAVSAYVSVRDTASRDLLAQLAPESLIEVVPDTGFNAAALLADDTASPGLRSGQSGPTGEGRAGYLVVQSRPEWRGWLPRASANARPSDLVLTPVAPVLGDLVRSPRDLPPQTTFRAPLDPHQMLALIARSNGVIGTSLHLTIAALSLGRPALRPASAARRKYGIVEGLAGVRHLDRRASESMLSLVDAGRVVPDIAELVEMSERLACHWDAVASLARASAAIARPAKTWRPLLVDFWERLPGTLERRSRSEDLRDLISTARRRLRRLGYTRWGG
jgi:hypothetical protein